jgi:hypothetical protein
MGWFDLPLQMTLQMTYFERATRNGYVEKKIGIYHVFLSSFSPFVEAANTN